VTLTFMGITFWLVPHLLRKPLFSPRMALWSAWTWFVGMMTFGLGMHWQGILGVPRRAHISDLPAAWAEAYANAQVPMVITSISGAILFVAIILYFTVSSGPCSAGPASPTPTSPRSRFTTAPPHAARGRHRHARQLRVWFVFAVFLVLVAYGPSLVYHVHEPAAGARVPAVVRGSAWT
jgi:cytochrome c oxidase subunit I